MIKIPLCFLAVSFPVARLNKIFVYPVDSNDYVTDEALDDGTGDITLPDKREVGYSVRRVLL